METVSTQLSRMKSTLNKIKSEITTVQQRNEESISNLSKYASLSSMKNLFQSSLVPPDKDGKKFLVSQINANNYTNYFILPKNEKRAPVQLDREDFSFQRNPQIKAFASFHAKTEKAIRPTHYYNSKGSNVTSYRSQVKVKESNQRVLVHVGCDEEEETVESDRDKLMFPHFTHDKVKKGKLTKGKFERRASSQRGADQRIALNQFIEDVLSVYRTGIELNELYSRVKRSLIRAKEVDELIKDLSSIFRVSHSRSKGELSQLEQWIKSTAMRQELYAHQIELYRSLCEELIDKSDINDLNAIISHANTLISQYDSIDIGNSYFIRSFNAMIKNKSSSSTIETS